MKRVILCYHSIGNDYQDNKALDESVAFHQHSLKLSKFKKQLQWLAYHSEVVELSALISGKKPCKKPF